MTILYPRGYAFTPAPGGMDLSVSIFGLGLYSRHHDSDFTKLTIKLVKLSRFKKNNIKSGYIVNDKSGGQGDGATGRLKFNIVLKYF